MKKILVLILAIALCVAFTACTASPSPSASQSAAPSQAASQAASPSAAVSAAPSASVSEAPSQAPSPSVAAKKVKIGFSNLVTNGFYATKYVDVFNATIKQRGDTAVQLDCNFDTATQIAQMDNLIAQKVDIIFLMPNDPKALIPSIQKAKAANIPVIIVHQKIDTSAENLTVGFAGADDVALGAGAGDLMTKALGGKGNIVTIGGSFGSGYMNDLTTGFKSKLAPDIKILANGDHGWDRSKATTVMENFLTKYDNIDGVWSSDDNTAIGCIAAIKAAGRTNIKVVGINGQSEAFDYIKSGDLYGTVIQDASGNVACVFQVLDEFLAGQTVPEYTYSKSPEVTKDNVATMTPAF